MKDSDIKGLTPKEIQDKFALPYLPDHVVDVKPPKGIKMRTGVAKENFNGNGGGTQYELLENININVFNNSRPL
jgi:filamentous hemagglutinin